MSTMVSRRNFDWGLILYDILPESGLIYKSLVTTFLTCRLFQKIRCGGEWNLLDFQDVQIGVHNGV